MGKEDEDNPESGVAPGNASDAGSGGACRRCFRSRCVATLLLGAAVLLSALFLLPPLDRAWHRHADPGPNSQFDATIMASFRLEREVAELHGNIPKLENDIYEEIGVPNSTVVVSSLEPINGSHRTNVVFSIVSYPDSTISSTWLSILRSSFMSLIVQQSTLHLTTSLFGNSSFFEVLKFPGGITIIPQQAVFLLQKPHASFNFTLNFPIYEVQNKVGELKEQMKSGLLLNKYENLYVKLTNLDGSTISPPTIVQTSIVLEVGNHQPSPPRLKQLAQTITNSLPGNLGLNHTVFGKVKQISLSSYLKHSLKSEGAGGPSPAPQPHPGHHHHHNHHQNTRGHGNDMSSAPAPGHRFEIHHGAPPSSGCPSRYSGSPKSRSSPTLAPKPVPSYHRSIPPVSSPPIFLAPAPSSHHASNPRPKRDSGAQSPKHSEPPHPPPLYASYVHPPINNARMITPRPESPSMPPNAHSGGHAGEPIRGIIIVMLLTSAMFII